MAVACEVVAASLCASSIDCWHHDIPFAENSTDAADADWKWPAQPSPSEVAPRPFPYQWIGARSWRHGLQCTPPALPNEIDAQNRIGSALSQPRARNPSRSAASKQQVVAVSAGSGSSVGANGWTPALLPSSFRFDMLPIPPSLSLAMRELALARLSFIGITRWRLAALHMEAL